MAPNRITPGGIARRAPFLLALCAAALLLVACGGGSSESTAAGRTDKDVDAEILNRVLAREMAAVDAYSRMLPHLHGADLAMAQRFRTQEQEHVDAVLKALRGLGTAAEPESETIEKEGVKTRADALTFLYEIESVSVGDALRAVSNLTAPWARSLLASIGANQAQHLVLLRRALGVAPLDTVPQAFEAGTALPPERPERPEPKGRQSAGR